MMQSWLVRGALPISLVFLFGCSSANEGPSLIAPVPEIPQKQTDEMVVRSTFSMALATSSSHLVGQFAPVPTEIPVTVVNAPNVKMDVYTKDFVIPPISNAVLYFGRLAISSLIDNNLKVCGDDKKTKCKKAYLRVYTNGAGPGLYNEADGYGMPITSEISGVAPKPVGLGPAGAAVMQSYDIPADKNVIFLRDFVGAASYAIRSDFTNAGAGSYSTTLVVEYGLSL